LLGGDTQFGYSATPLGWAGLGLDNLLDRYTQLIYLVTQTRYLAWLPLIENSLIKHYRPIKATL